MPRRIDIELTSARPDGSWTWRVSGARQPKGVLDGSLLPPGAKVGDVLRAEAESELDGTTVLSVAQPPGKRPDPERLELLTASRPFEGVTTSLVPKSTRPRRDHDDRGPRRDRGERGPRGDREGRGPRTDRPEGRPGPRREGETGPARAHGEGRDGEGAGRGAGEGRTRAPREGAPTDRGARPPAAASRGRAGTRPPARRPDGHGPENAD